MRITPSATTKPAAARAADIDPNAAVQGRTSDLTTTTSGHHQGSPRSRQVVQTFHRARVSVTGFVGNLGSDRVPCTLRLTNVQFFCVWTTLLFFHAGSSVYFFFATYLHYYILLTQSQIIVANLGGQVLDYIPYAMAINGVLCVVHAVAALTPVLGSLQRRELSFQAPQLSQCYSRRSVSCQRKQTTPESGQGHEGNTTTTTLFAKLFGSAGLFGMEIIHFDVVFQLIELIVGTSQMYQAWKLSHLVPTIWINRMYAVILVLQFWSAFLLHYFFHHRGVALYRVLCLATNVVLDFVSLTVFPVAIFLPYVRQFDPVYGDFPIFFYYDDTLISNAVAENQQLFVMGPLDLFTKIMPAVSVLASLFALRNCFTKADTSAAIATGKPRQVVVASRQRPPALGAVPSAWSSMREISSFSSSAAVVQNHQPTTKQQRPVVWEKRFHQLLGILFPLWGVLIALVHLHATTVATWGNNPGCYLHLRPWFLRTYTCVVLEINCETQGHVGQQDQMEMALQGFTTTLRGLVISGCPQLQLPRRLQDLSNLRMLKIYNSSIQQWASDAALTATHHPVVTMLYVVHTNFSEPSTLPPGVLSDDFPPTLHDIELCGTNLASLPPILKQKWKFMQYFVLENSPGTTEFPMALVELRVPQLYLSGNRITSIPDHLLVNQSFWTLSLTGNPIPSLPASIGDLHDLYRLRLGYSGLVTVPLWMQDGSVSAGVDTFQQTVDVKAGGSPLCVGTPPPTSKYFAIDCSTDPEENWPLVYPLEKEEELRAKRLASLREQKAGS